jgi:uncharacterized protein (TIGR02466 family)
MTGAAFDTAPALSRPIAQCVEAIFPTPVASHLWPDSAALNDALRAVILTEEARGPSAGRSNVGGWHGPSTFFRRPEPCVRELSERARVMTEEMTRAMMAPGKHRFAVEAWANVLRQGQYNAPHVHPNSTWSGVYYVTGNPPPPDGDDAYSGKIEFIDPRPGASAAYTVDNAMQRRAMLNPDAGAMILFPSWLQHQVHPYRGPGVRISVAFNVLVTP